MALSAACACFVQFGVPCGSTNDDEGSGSGSDIIAHNGTGAGAAAYHAANENRLACP